MNQIPAPEIAIPVDPVNPGQFFACCGLLELADRLWPGVEAWFESGRPAFCLAWQSAGERSLASLIRQVGQAGLIGELSPGLNQERLALEARKRQMKQQRQDLSESDEKRRAELGKLLREGSILIPEPFQLQLDWWKSDTDETPKTWAGSQEVYRIARAALASSGPAFACDDPFSYSCVMRAAEEQDAGGKKVEPFYFDARRGSSAMPIDIGFSPDSLQMISAACPAVEFLCLVGLQRFRPKTTSLPRVFEYYTWKSPLAACVAPLAVSGLLSQCVLHGYRFENAFRTDQKKHKAFSAATPI